MNCFTFLRAMPLLWLLAASAAGATEGQSHLLVVSETVQIRVNATGSSTTDRTVMLKALDAAGARALCTYTIPYQASRQTVYVIDGSIVYGDEPEVALQQSDYDDEPMSQTAGAPAYPDARRLRVNFHGVRVGSVVRIHTRQVERRPFLPGVFSAFEIEPRRSPIQEIHYEITAPQSMHLLVQANELKGGLHVAGGVDKWDFSAEKLPALINVASTSEMLSKSPFIAVTQATSVGEVAQLYLRRTQAPQHISLELQHLADSIGGRAIDPAQLVRRYYAWINDHVRLVDLPLEMGLETPRKAQDILLSGYGTAEDRVIVLQSLMRAKEMAADLVLVPSMPVSWQLRIPGNTAFDDRILLTADNGLQVLDIGNPVLALGEHGPGDGGKLGIRMSVSGAVAPIQIPVSAISSAASSVSTVITFGPDGSMSGSSRIVDYGDLAAVDREGMGGDPLALRKRLSRSAPQGTEISVGHTDDPRKPSNLFRMDASFHLSGYQQPEGGYVTLIPRPVIALSPLDDFASSQGQGLCQRTWRQEQTEIVFNPRHPVIVPKNVDISVPGALGHYTATYLLRSNGNLRVTRTLQLSTNPLQCDHASQAAIARLAAAVRRDLDTEVNVLR